MQNMTNQTNNTIKTDLITIDIDYIDIIILIDYLPLENIYN